MHLSVNRSWCQYERRRRDLFDRDVSSPLYCPVYPVLMNAGWGKRLAFLTSVLALFGAWIPGLIVYGSQVAETKPPWYALVVIFAPLELGIGSILISAFVEAVVWVVRGDDY